MLSADRVRADDAHEVGGPTSAEAALGDARTEAEITYQLGESPVCVDVDEVSRVCAWREIGNRNDSWKALAGLVGTRYRVTLVCHLLRTASAGVAGAEDGHAEGRCVVYPARSNRYRYKQRNDGAKQRRKKRLGKQASASERLETAVEAARADYESAEDLAAMISLVGDTPTCVSGEGSVRRCRWRLHARTWGHGTIALVFDQSPGDRLRLDCPFGPGGELAGKCAATPGS